MDFDAVPVDIGTRTPTVLVNRADAAELGVNPLDRVQVTEDGVTHVGIVEVTDTLVGRGELGMTAAIGHVDGPVSVSPAPRPAAVHHVRRKLDEAELDRRAMRTIVRDIHDDRLNDVELAAFVTGTYTNGLSLAETSALAAEMADVGERIEWDAPVVADKHSIGGVAGNRVTPVVVPIVAAAGLPIPKTSSRAVTSPAGTADTMEVFCDVTFGVEDIRRIVDEAGGCMVWGGGVDLSPVDDRIIRAENPLSLDPPGQVVASVLSKKHSAGASHVVVDIPYGEGSKVTTLPDARDLAASFRAVASDLELTVVCTITRGERPVGRGIGPTLEARDVLAVLDGDGPEALRLKSLRLAEELFDVCDVDADPAAILDDGRALETFRDIVAAQNGDRDVTRADLRPGRHTEVVTAPRDGVVTHANNRLLSDVARRAGAPRDNGAGIYLHRLVGDEVTAGDDLYTVHAERPAKLTDAVSVASRSEVLRVRPPGEALVERA